MGRLNDALAAYEEAMARFPNNEVARGGYAEVLKEMGRLNDTLAAYKEAIARFPNNEVVRHGYASVLMLMNRFSEVRALLSGTRLSSEGDWIAYHIVAMSYLRSGEIEEAIRRLAYGLENSPWPTDKFYFASALALAKIKKRQFEEVLDVLPTNVIGLDVFQKQTRLVLVGHSQAALGRKEEAARTLAQLEQAANPRVINLKEAIARRYDLKGESSIGLSPDEEDLLETKIYEEEFFLAMAA
jgi:tetratricopeptide (TPR) repeat protein